MPAMFDHEKLAVYQEAIKFVAWADELLKDVPKSMAVHNQLERAATSIPLNIAEGNGKYTAPDRCRFFDMARGSALECAACLDVLGHIREFYSRFASRRAAGTQRKSF